MTKVRRPAVAGQFYPDNEVQLRKTVNKYLGEIGEKKPPIPKAVIAPHAGYIYSGPIAGTAYAHLARANGGIRRVVLLGPAHRAYVRGLALSSAEAFASPLGSIPVDREAHELLLSLPSVCVYDGVFIGPSHKKIKFFIFLCRINKR